MKKRGEKKEKKENKKGGVWERDERKRREWKGRESRGKKEAEPPKKDYVVQKPKKKAIKKKIKKIKIDYMRNAYKSL